MCPLTQTACVQHKCEWYIQIHGTNPNTGEVMNKFGCAVAWLPVLFIENTQSQRQTGAAVESFRNEMVEANKKAAALMRSNLLNNIPHVS